MKSLAHTIDSATQMRAEALTFQAGQDAGQISASPGQIWDRAGQKAPTKSMGGVLPLGIVLGVVPVALVTIYAIDSTPCQNGPCWPHLTIGQVLVLTMLILSAFIKFLIYLSGAVSKFAVPVPQEDRNDTEMQTSGQELGKVTPDSEGQTKMIIANSKESPNKSSKPTLDETCTLLIRLGSILLLFFICDKTTLLKHLLEHPETKNTAIIVNDMAEVAAAAAATRSCSLALTHHRRAG